MGIETALIIGGLAAGIGTGVALSSGGKDKGGEAPKIEMPQAPTAEDAQERARKISRARKRDQSQTVFTSPLGIGGEAQVAKKKLLGE